MLQTPGEQPLQPPPLGLGAEVPGEVKAHITVSSPAATQCGKVTQQL